MQTHYTHRSDSVLNQRLVVSATVAPLPTQSVGTRRAMQRLLMARLGTARLVLRDHSQREGGVCVDAEIANIDTVDKLRIAVAIENLTE